MPGDDELDLIARAARGDHDAFRDLVVRYEGRLITYLTQMLGDVESARDCAQDTFVAAYHALPRWHPPPVPSLTPLAPWLYRIATNRALSLLRQPALNIWADVSEALALPQREPPVEEHVIARELLRQALRALSDEDAACLVLHYVAGERYGEIAARLGMTGEAVRKRVARGLVALRAAYLALDAEVAP